LIEGKKVYAVLTRGGLTNCSALPQNSTGLYGDSDVTVSVDHDTAKRICDMYKATFAISIILVVLFLVSAIFQFFIGKHHQREKRQSHLSKGPVPVSQPLWRRRFGRRGKQEVTLQTLLLPPEAGRQAVLYAERETSATTERVDHPHRRGAVYFPAPPKPQHCVTVRRAVVVHIAGRPAEPTLGEVTSGHCRQGSQRGGS